MEQPDMEITFLTFHDLTPTAKITFASESITEILGYQPEEVVGRSCFEYFHPEEVPLAQYIHNRNVQLDKAAALHYARIQARNGDWVACECVFTVVYNVLVGCTSIYRGDRKNRRRAAEAPVIRRIFSSTPKDPRYHMLEHLSSKFRTPLLATPLEPRAALMLNRFSREANVMFATNAVESILGITADQFLSKSFYECIQEDCLPEAIRILESAKANDSIAYLRFMYRSPLGPDASDEDIGDTSESSDSEGGVELHDDTHHSGRTSEQAAAYFNGPNRVIGTARLQSQASLHRASSGDSTDQERNDSQAIFDDVHVTPSSSSSLNVSSTASRCPQQERVPPSVPHRAPIEIEAVISCTSDGLVVVLRRARPLPPPGPLQCAVAQTTPNGYFAAPWGVNPVRPHEYQPNQQAPFRHGFGAPPVPVDGPPQDMFLQAIREVAVFAWSLTGINGNLASYSHGVPRGESQPSTGLPIWDPYAQPCPSYVGPTNQAAERWSRIDPSSYQGRQEGPRSYQRHGCGDYGYDGVQ